MNNYSNLPYSDILHGILLSIKRAQAEVIRSRLNPGSVGDYIHWTINRNFSWLCLKRKAGIDRHLVQAPTGLNSLLTNKLRKKKELLNDYGDAFNNYQFPEEFLDQYPEINDSDKYFATMPWALAQHKATRISALIVASISDVVAGKPLKIEHPLSVAYKFLTHPDLPATKAYALIAIRGYLMFQIGRADKKYTETKKKNLFTAAEVNVHSIEKAMSFISTSTNVRFNSKGMDPLPVGNGVDAYVKHHLAMRQVLECHFQYSEDAVRYLESSRIICLGDDGETNQYQLVKNERILRLPSTSEISNEILGIPLPLEGAETLFRGGLRTSTSGSLVMAVHGGPGSGKTSFTLAICAYLALFGVPSLYLTSEESSSDLYDRMLSVVPEELTRLSFYPKALGDLVTFGRHEGELNTSTEDKYVSTEASQIVGNELLIRLKAQLEQLKLQLPQNELLSDLTDSLQKPCRAVIVLDGIHDLFFENTATQDSLNNSTQLSQLYELVALGRSLQVLVILTTGSSLGGLSERRLDHLVDIAMHLNHSAADQTNSHQNRQITLTKARYQLCSPGTHGFNVASTRGVRIVPQISDEIERHKIWKTQLPDKKIVRLGLTRGANGDFLDALFKNQAFNENAKYNIVDRTCDNGIKVFDRSHVFINGHGSGGKAALALKLGLSCVANSASTQQIDFSRREKVLIISFLYPEDYYGHIIDSLEKLREREFAQNFNEHIILLKTNIAQRIAISQQVDVLHLRPGYLKPDELFQMIEARLNAAIISGTPHTCVILDGIHNVFLQFPEIEKNRLFWAQLYSSLRTRQVTTITTHATLTMPYQSYTSLEKVDDHRSEPLRQSLVQKTDYQIEVDPILISPYILQDIREALDPLKFSRFCVLKAVSAVENTPRGFLIWDRETFQIYDPPKFLIQRGKHDSGDQRRLNG